MQADGAFDAGQTGHLMQDKHKKNVIFILIFNNLSLS
jgi:hypothetical protein